MPDDATKIPDDGQPPKTFADSMIVAAGLDKAGNLLPEFRRAIFAYIFKWAMGVVATVAAFCGFGTIGGCIFLSNEVDKRSSEIEKRAKERIDTVTANAQAKAEIEVTTAASRTRAEVQAEMNKATKDFAEFQKETASMNRDLITARADLNANQKILKDATDRALTSESDLQKVVRSVERQLKEIEGRMTEIDTRIKAQLLLTEEKFKGLDDTQKVAVVNLVKKATDDFVKVQQLAIAAIKEQLVTISNESKKIREQNISGFWKSDDSTYLIVHSGKYFMRIRVDSKSGEFNAEVSPGTGTMSVGEQTGADTFRIWYGKDGFRDFVKKGDGDDVFLLDQQSKREFKRMATK